MTPDEVIAPSGLTLDGVVAYWAGLRPDAPVLEYFGGPAGLTWGAFETYVQGAAEQVANLVSRGERVAMVCDDVAECHVLVNALWRRGAGVLLLNRTWGRTLVADLVAHLGCAVVFAPETWPVALPPGVTRVAMPALREPLVPAPENAGDPDSVAMYATTSGTTDNPKCVAVTHRQIRSAYRSCLGVHDFTRVRRSASLFPLNGLGVLGVCFLLPREVGASTLVLPPFTLANIGRSWEAVVTGGVDFVYLVPPLVRLLRALPPVPRNGAEVLAFCAAAPVERDELRAVEDRYPIRVYNAYGLTELTFAVFFGCRDADGGASGSIGPPVGIDAKLVRADGVEVTSSPGEGELYIAGPMLTDGYVGNPAATAASWSDGWLRTGDLAERDAEGRYYIRGRVKEFVIRGGVLTYLYEVEHYLRKAPGVVDACAFKGRDLASGDELCVLVQVNGPVTPRDLTAWLDEHVGSEKVPNVVLVQREELPRNSSGKVERARIGERYRSGGLPA